MSYDSPMATPDGLSLAEQMMTEGSVHPSAIAAFAHSYRVLAAGGTGILPEADIEPVDSLPRLADLQVDQEAARNAPDLPARL